ncbi:hypothetical protein V6N13_147028 [Hibiscus sabdariffa]
MTNQKSREGLEAAAAAADPPMLRRWRFRHAVTPNFTKIALFAEIVLIDVLMEMMDGNNGGDGSVNGGLKERLGWRWWMG